jgi:type IV pilus assembly protein PilF
VALALLVAGCASSAEREAEAARKRQLVDTNTQLAVSYLGRGQLDAAREKIEKALETAPDDAGANTVMALILWRDKQFDGADRYFRRALDADPPSLEAVNNYAVFLCERGRLDEAVRRFEQVARDPAYRTPALAYENAGLCLMRKPAPAAAERHFREALRLDPKLQKSLLAMARISYDSGKALSARGFIQRFFQVAEDSPDSLLLATRIERSLKDRDAEASYALRLRGKFPESPEAAQLAKESARPRPR